MPWVPKRREREEERGERGERTSLEPLPHRSVMDRLIREQAMGEQATRNILAREQATGEQAAMYNLEREQAMAASEIRARTRDDSDGEEEVDCWHVFRATVCVCVCVCVCVY